MQKKLLAGISEKNHALALGGGGFNGAYTMQLLYNLRDFFPKQVSFIAGTSIGSYNAAILCEEQFNGATFQQATEAGLELWEKVSQKPPIGWDILSTFKLQGALSTNAVRKFFIKNRIIPLERTLADYANKGLRLFIPATDLSQGITRYATNGESVINSMIVSGAFPLAFPAQKIPGSDHLFTDGGVLENMPLNPLIDCGAESISAFFLSTEAAINGEEITSNKHKNALDVVMRIMDILLQKATLDDIENAEKINRLVLAWPKLSATARKQIQAILQIKHVENKRLLLMQKFFPSKELPATFDWSKEGYQKRIDLANKDAQQYR